MTFVTVMRDKFARSYPRHERGALADVTELGGALEREYLTDAHFAAYASSNRRRLCREALDQGVTVALTAIVFDVDCDSVHGTGAAVPTEWRRFLREKVCSLAEVHPEPFFYETRGGARIVYVQSEPTVIRSHEDALEWSQTYAVAIAYLHRRFGIVADAACQDWQRLYRLPHATREPGGMPENRPTWGDPNRIGPLCIDATHADVEAAKRASKAFRAPRVLDFRPVVVGGSGLLFHLLQARGHIFREHRSGSFIIRCPREHEHSTGCTGDGSTLLYLPASGEEIGAVHCLHAHCASMSVAEWLGCFDATELERARRAAGITDRDDRLEAERRAVWQTLVLEWTSANEWRAARGRRALRPGVVWHWFRDRVGDRPPPRGCRLPLPFRGVAA